MECAGFLNGIAPGSVTLLVRHSILRGFDRDIVDKVVSYMEASKVKFVQGVTPEKIVKLVRDRIFSLFVCFFFFIGLYIFFFLNLILLVYLFHFQSSGKFQVFYSSGESDIFDTVLAAVGRIADTFSLGTESIKITTNKTNGKIICKNEQTSVKNIYAIGDVVDDTPELTPVAIMAGKLLARRLFNRENNVSFIINHLYTFFLNFL